MDKSIYGHLWRIWLYLLTVNQSILSEETLRSIFTFWEALSSISVLWVAIFLSSCYYSERACFKGKCDEIAKADWNPDPSLPLYRFHFNTNTASHCGIRAKRFILAARLWFIWRPGGNFIYCIYLHNSCTRWCRAYKGWEKQILFWKFNSIWCAGHTWYDILSAITSQKTHVFDL